ncbi:alanine--tRNA ligase [bacterium]|nr:alanine--tRNA ligase [bacterium]
MITADELRKKFLDFFSAEGHTIIPSASLVPNETDPTVLFTTAGMHPLAPYLTGEKHPKGKRLVNVQKCLRTGDIEDVGDSSHNTFFEMLGNWSLGDYFKNDSIKWSWEFLTDKKWLEISPEKIKVTVFEGDNNASRDDESIKIWRECFKKSGISLEVYDKEKGNNKTARIFPLPKKDNWWGPAGETGPCGPDTEIFIDLGKPVNSEKCSNGDECQPGCKCGRYVEIWNNVFMEFNKQRTVNSEQEYEYVKLKQKNVDTGMGLERMLAVLNGLDNVYETELFAPIVEEIEKLSEKKYGESKDTKKSMRIIADHIKAAVFIISDGVVPSNVGRGYVLRRLIRRAVRHGKILGIEKNFTKQIAEAVIGIYKETYPEVEGNKEKIFGELEKEENKFRKTLGRGLKIIKNYELRIKNNGENVSGKEIFDLYQSYGFPIEMSLEELEKRGVKFSEDELRKGFDTELKKHQELSRTASAGKFKGGLADGGEKVKKLHTATHLLLAALRKVLGDHIFQKGSNITAERLRFDFSHPEKLTNEQKQEVEELVNEAIKKELPVSFEEVKLNEAKKMGAMGVFEAKYGDKVKVYTIGDSAQGGSPFSREICGGPHVKNTGELGKFKIVKEQSSGAGVRRIKAVLIQ